MLKQFSRARGTHKYVVIIFAALMGLSLILFYAPGRNQVNANPSTNTEVLAKVNRDEITVADLYRQKQAYQQRFGGQFSLSQLGLNDKSMLDGLVRGKLVAQEAVRLGLGASDAEVNKAVHEQFKDESGKFIGVDKYKERIGRAYGSVERFENELRESIAADKLRAFVTAGVSVSEEEVREDFKRKNSSFNLTYVPVVADKLAANLQLSDEDLQKYYEENKTNFRYLEPQKKIRYLFISQTKSGEKLTIPDADLRAAFDALKPENKQAGVRVQQIVLKVARKDLDQQVLAKATKIVQDMRGPDSTVANVSEEKFAEAAKGNSEDPATATKGGWLPAPVRRDPNRKNDLQQATLDMQEGQVADPVFTKGAYYIFRRGASVPKTFEETKNELLVSQRNTRAYKTAAELAARAAARLKETKDFQKVAGELAAEANMSAGEMVKETSFVKPGDDVPEIGSSPQFEDAIKPLENANDVGDRVSIKNGFAVPMLVEKREPRIPDFAEVKDEVTKRAKAARAASQLEQTARDLATNNSASVADLKAAAEKLGLEVKTADAYKLGSPLESAGTSAAADDAIYNLKEGEVSKSPVKLGDSWVVVAATKRTDADLAEFAKERDQLTQTLLTTRRNDVFEDYVNAMRTRLDREGKVKIYEDVLARNADEDESAAPVPFRGGGIPGQ